MPCQKHTWLAAEVLAAGGFAVCSPDMPGHGESDGLRGFLLSSEALEEDGEAFAREARRLKPGLPLFLAGSYDQVNGPSLGCIETLCLWLFQLVEAYA